MHFRPHPSGLPTLLRFAPLAAVICLALSCPKLLVAEPADVGRAANPTASPRPVVVGYFGQWGVYEHFFVRNLVTSGAASRLDQMNYAQGSVAGGLCHVADPNADLNLTFSAEDSVDGRPDSPTSTFRGNFHQLAELKQQFPRLRILISLEGHAADFALAAQPQNRPAFVASCIDTFIRGHLPSATDAAPSAHPDLFDGIDLDWEYPHPEDAANYIALLTELRRAMDAVRPGLRLSVAVGPAPQMYPGVDISAVAGTVDQIGIMNYDYSGPWSPNTGFLAPLFSTGGDSVDASIRAYIAAGVPPSKLLMGIPFYGYGWREVADTGHGLFQAGRPIRGDRPYSFFEPLTHPQPAPGATPAEAPASTRSPVSLTPASDPAAGRQAPIRGAYVVYRDPQSQAPWLFDGSTFWTYEDPISIRAKVSFALQQRLGGVMAWELSEDSATADLVKAVRTSLDARLPAMERNATATQAGSTARATSSTE